MTGYTKRSAPSAPFPITPDAYDTTFNGGAGLVDAFVTKLDITRSAADALLYSTFLGSSINDYGSGAAVNVNEAQTVYVTGSTVGADFPYTSGALDISLSGTNDAFVTKLAVPSPWTRVYYVGDITKLGDIGTTLGIHDRDTPGTQDHLVVLNFGHPHQLSGLWGSKLRGFGTFVPIDDPFSSNDIIASSLAVAQNYRFNTGVDAFSSLRLVIGTTNAIDRKQSATWIQGHGGAWADMVDTLRSLIATCCYPQVSVVGGNDMEAENNTPGMNFTGAYSTTLWVNSYVAASDCIPSAGDAGCLYNFGTNAANAGGACATTWSDPWTYCDVSYISWRVKKNPGDTHTMARPLPQIYTTSGTNSDAWHDLSAYSVNVWNTAPVYFVGSLTQKGACQQAGCPATEMNTPDQGWIQLWADLYSDPVTRGTSLNLRWLTDIKNQCYPFVPPPPTVCQP
jgi:hypothetical protein